jgi:hypothetical protein
MSQCAGVQVSRGEHKSIRELSDKADSMEAILVSLMVSINVPKSLNKQGRQPYSM